MIFPALALALAFSVVSSSPQDGASPEDRGAGNAVQGTVPLPLEVRVVRADDGKPLAGTIVRLGARSAVTAGGGAAALGGVPAGRTELSVTRAGFAEWKRPLDLALGTREPVLVELEPAPPATLTGRVLRGTDGAALATAQIMLEPLEVPDGVQGPIRAAVDREGAFSLVDLPAGRYGATVRAPGCVERRLEMQVPGEAVDISLALDTSPASLAVLILDGESGAPVPGVTVHLSEAWPLGVFGTAATTDDGRAGFDGVALGSCNRASEDGRVPAMRRHATIHVEAEGYAAQLLPVTLAPGASIQVEMVRERDVPSPDRGDQPASASSLELGAWQVCTVTHAGDRDHFRVRLADAARLMVDLAEAPPLNVEVVVSRASGERVATHRRYSGQAFSFHVDLTPGEYLVSFGHWGNTATSETPVRLRVSAQMASDANEPNDTQDAARRIVPGESVRGAILPVGDVDTFRFELEHAGVFHAVAHPMGLPRTVVVRDATGKELANSSGYGGQTVQVEAHLAAGSYTVEIRNWGDSASSPEPWCLDTSLVEGDGVLDPVTVAGARPALPRRELAPHAFAASTVAPRGDVDVHGVRVGSAGRLHVQLRAPFSCRVRVRDDSGAILAENARYAGQSLTLVAEVPAPALLRVEVGPWGEGAWSPHPYALRTRFVPCGDDELAGRNDVPERATPALVGDVLRGNITPVGDVDVHAIAVDHPGHLVVRGVLPGAMTVRILDTSGQELAASSRYGGQTLTVAADIGRAGALVEARCWGNAAVEGSYALVTTLEREDPADVGDPGRDAARALPDGEARSYAIVRAGDKDVFVHTTASPGKWKLSWTCPINTTVQVFDDRSGAELANKSRYGGQRGSVKLEAKGPTRYRIVVSGWGNNVRGAGTGLIMADAASRDVTGAKIEVRPDPARPTEVEFVAGPLAGAAEATSIEIDVDGDGRADTRLAEGRGRVSLPAQGIYRATVRATGADGAASVSHLWVDATGPRERSGVFVVIDDPTPGALVETSSPARLRAMSYSGTPIARVAARIEGRPEPLAITRRAPYELQVPWQKLGSGDHTLVFEATDARGTSAAVRRDVTISPYLDLSPADGAQLTGEAALVSWTSDGFGPARVRYRPLGTEVDWAESVGASSARPRVLLANLEFDTEYEWQALGAEEPSPARTFSLVRGLAFGRRGYGATIARDYDQRIPISVRNHAEQPMRVELSCGAPAEGSLLLVGFVEEGSADEPFDLGPGEEREFVLALSAQDVITSRHEFPVRIRSDAGLADEALVTVDVVLPRVDLAWDDLGPTEDGLGRRMRVRNDGDGLTDLALSTSDPRMRLTPSVEHGLLAPGATLDVEARPRLHEGFSALAADVRATAVGTTSEAAAEVALPDGEELYQVAIAPYVGVLEEALENTGVGSEGIVAASDETIVRSFVGVLEQADEAPPVDPDTFEPRPELPPPGEAVEVGEHIYSERPRVERAPDKEKLLGIGLDARALRWLHAEPEEVDALLVAARNLAGAYLGPGLAPTGGTPEDMDGDGQPDRTSVLDEAEGIRWTREGDPAGTQFVTADLGDDGQVDWAAFVRPDGTYEETNLVGARLELDFELPRHRWTHRPHDVDVLVNDVPVASLKDSIPEGGYSFRLPPTALAFTEDGRSDSNRVKLDTRHLRGGHYVVTSDFRLTAELLGTRTWTAGPDRETARARLEGTTGYVVGRPDHSVSSHELEVVGPTAPEAGTPMVLRVPLRSVGGATARQVEVALLRGEAGAKPVELARQVVDGRGLPQWVSFDWTAAPGDHALRIVVDPDERLDEASRANDVALTSLTVPGDDAPPTVAFTAPAEGADPASGIVDVLVEADDDVEIARLELAVDGGPWHALDPRRGAARVLLQPGQRRLVARATDGSGNRANAERTLLVPGAAPALAIDAPADGTTLTEREVEVVLTVGPEVEVAAARAAGGTWTRLAVEDGVARGRVPVPFGGAAIEAVAVDRSGARSVASRVVVQSTQRTADEAEQEATAAPGHAWIEVPGFGRVDALGEAQAVRVEGETDDAEGSEEPAPRDEAADGRRPGPGPFVPPPQPPLRRERPASISATPRGPVLESRTEDWYCTNRPSVGVGFELPPGLVRGDLPKPGTPEFDAMVAELLALLRARGVDTGPLERFQESLLARARGLESPGDMPGFLESLGFDWFTEAPDEAGRKRWRDLMELRTQAWWLRLLATGDPALIREGLRRRGQAFGLFDGAMQESTQAAIIATQANQRLAEDVLNALPYVGEANDILALYRGETLSGQKLTAFGAVLTSAGLLAPFGLEQLFKRSAKARRLLSRLGEMGEGMTDAAKRKLAKALGKSFDDVDIAFRKITDFMTKERSLLRNANSETADAARRAFVNSTEGAADLRRMRQAERNAASIVEDLDVLSQSRRQAQQQLDALRRTGADPAAIRRVEQQVADLDGLFVRRATDLQGDKLAQRVVNSDAARDALRRDVNDVWKRVYSDVDDAVGRRLKDTDLVRDIARRRGADMDDVVVKPLSITNKRPSTGGRTRTSVGRDRDITYVVERIRRGADGAPLRGPKGEILTDYLGDVPHGPRGISGQTDEMLEGSKGVYLQEFWRSTRGEPVPDLTSDLGRRQLQDWGAHLDQMVTSKFHREAYAVGEVKLDAFLDKGIRPTLTRPQDIADTFRVKSDHWFHSSDSALREARSLRNAGNVAAAEVALVRASKDTAEGMRQATKQYNDLILSRARQYGLRPDVHVPARLQSAMEIFDDVGKGVITPRQAEEMLRSLSPRGPGGKVLYELDPRRVVDELSGFIEGMEQSAGNAYRTIKTAEVLDDLPRAIGGKGPQEALDRITAELNAGHISGETFNKLEGYLNRSLVDGHVDADTFMALRQGLMDRTRDAARRIADARSANATLSSWAGQAYQRRLISVGERQTLAEPMQD